MNKCVPFPMPIIALSYPRSNISSGSVPHICAHSAMLIYILCFMLCICSLSDTLSKFLSQFKKLLVSVKRRILYHRIEQHIHDAAECFSRLEPMRDKIRT